MVRPDYFDDPNNLPDYYDTMQLDGFEPWQIMEALHRTIRKRLAEQRKQPDDYTVNIESNVSVKK